MILNYVLQTDHVVISMIEKRTERYRQLKLKSQPCVVLVGQELSSIQKSYVSFNHVLWSVGSPGDAIDTLFKAFFTFNLQYPVDCEHLWLVIQKHVYEIAKRGDKKIAAVTTISSILKKLEKPIQSL